jgi:hypothetical protein
VHFEVVIEGLGAQWPGSASTSLRTTLTLGSQGGGNMIFGSRRWSLRWLYQDGNEFPICNP